MEQHNCSTDSSESDLDLGAFTDIPSSVETHFVDNSVNKSWGNHSLVLPFLYFSRVMMPLSVIFLIFILPLTQLSQTCT